MVIKRRDKRAWTKIFEAFIAILLIMGVALIILEEQYSIEKDSSIEIYNLENSILKGMQEDNALREIILEETLPSDFNLNLVPEIDSRIPNYLTCSVRICEIDGICESGEITNENIYAQSTVIFANLENYNPRQLKLFCWEN